MNDTERRVKLVFVGEADVLDLACVVHRGCEGTHAVKFPLALPDGAQILRVHHDQYRRQFAFLVRHDSFEPVPDGMATPDYDGGDFVWMNTRRVTIETTEQYERRTAPVMSITYDPMEMTDEKREEIRAAMEKTQRGPLHTLPGFVGHTVEKVQALRDLSDDIERRQRDRERFALRDAANQVGLESQNAALIQCSTTLSETRERVAELKAEGFRKDQEIRRLRLELVRLVDSGSVDHTTENDRLKVELKHANWQLATLARDIRNLRDACDRAGTRGVFDLYMAATDTVLGMPVDGPKADEPVVLTKAGGEDLSKINGLLRRIQATIFAADCEEEEEEGRPSSGSYHGAK